MERFSQRESLLLGYSNPQRFFASPSASNKSSDVDFHDVFGGPPRRSSVHEMRYSFTEGSTDSNALKRVGVCGDGDDEDDEGWSGLNEKPVFGEESVNRRRTQSDDFFNDIFRGTNSVTSSPSRRLQQRDPYSSAPGSRVLSPARPLPPKSDPSTSSSMPTQFSLPSRLTHGVDLPTVGSSARTASLSRFSNQSIQSSEDSRNGSRSYIRQSFSYTGGEGSSNLLTSDDKVDTGSNLEQDSKSKDSPTSSSPFQFHFSIYKWASKGVPVVMPLRGRHGSRVGKRTKAEETPSTDECPADNESTALQQSPKSTLPNVGFPSDDHPIADARSPNLEPNKQENDLLLPDESTPGKVDPFHFVEEAILPVAESETLSSLDNAVEDVTVSYQTIEDIKRLPLITTDYCEYPRKETPVLGEQIHKPGLEPVRSLFFDDDLQQGNDEILKVGGRKESVVEGTKKSSVDDGSNKIAKNGNGKRASLTNTEVDKASFQCSLRREGDNLGKSKVRGKVKDFVKMFNQEARCKPALDGGDLGSPSSKIKDKGTSKRANEASIGAATRKYEDLQKSNVKDTFPDAAAKEASISTTRMYEDLQKSKAKDTFPDAAANEASISTTRMYEDLQQRFNVRERFPDVSIMINEGLKRPVKEDCEVKAASYMLSDAPGREVLASSTGSGPNGSMATIEDAYESFQMKELTHDEKKQPQADSNREEIRAIDDKIRKWSRGKEGNIRSLLTTMQYVLWPESGWKTVPLVDIIEGNAVKRSYQRALLCLHPDKLQQKGVSEHHKYLAAKVFEILQEAWDHFNLLGSL